MEILTYTLIPLLIVFIGLCLLDIIITIALGRNARKIDEKRWKQFQEDMKKHIEEGKK
jgi:hypothetical protein